MTTATMTTTTTMPFTIATTFVRILLLNFGLLRRDRFGPKIVKIRAILVIFRAFGLLTPLGS